MTNIQNNTDIHAKFFYFNDLHANIKGAKKLKTASDAFDISAAAAKADSFKFCAGDSYIGRTKNNFIGRFLNLLGLDGMVLGNHELDMGTKQLSKFMDNNLFKIFTCNLNFKKGNNFEDDIQAGRLVKSSIIEKNGNKYGIIGATASDILDTISIDSKEDCIDIDFMNLEQTTTAIQEEINKLKQQGINKIILISHLGIEADQKVVQATDGIDVVIGGHSHHKIDGIKTGENYFASKSGEPVIIVQAGQNGENTGLLDVIFDSNGKIKAAQNKLSSIKDAHNSLLVDYLEKISFDKIEDLGELTSALPLKKEGFEEHPLSCFVADAMKEKSGAQIAFHNKGCQKATLKPGLVTNRDIATALPYINSVSMYKFSEKDLIETLKASLNEPTGSHKIGNIQVSGMTYTIDKNNNLKDVYVLDGDKKIKLDENNPSNDKFFTVAYGAFFAGGPGVLKMLHCPEKRIQKFDWEDQQATIELMKKRSVDGKINIQCDGRIKVER